MTPADEPDCAEDLAAVLRSLIDDARFAELGEALRSVEQLSGAQRRRALALCRAGARLVQLDAVGFDEVDGVPADLAAQVRAMRFPDTYDDPDRGSLASLVPLYGLMLEVLETHWSREETAFVVLVLHLMAEYLPVLAWESVLGHAADPPRLRDHVTGTMWGTEDCPMPRHRRSAAERVLAMRPGEDSGPVPPEQWRAYLDRWHARVAAGLRQCALRPGRGRPDPGDAGCDRACGVVTVLPGEVLENLADRMTLAAAFASSPVVALRHSAPVGHFFGVPGPDDVQAAWAETLERIGRPWEDGAGEDRNLVLADVADVADVDGDERRPEALPGLAGVLTVVAGQPIRPTTVLDRLRREVTAVLDDVLAG